eukprot:TRINITY_DN26148_c0_g1_i1.p2 TRINITY_DN26148_c0_g1~~TRINITY_DN26148_c0_g1_i1.p2  ORF type:complete len:103 (+),score=12.95 TRINITY_DN26148_c0_g1_i1:49-357(+)
MAARRRSATLLVGALLALAGWQVGFMAGPLAGPSRQAIQSKTGSILGALVTVAVPLAAPEPAHAQIEPAVWVQILCAVMFFVILPLAWIFDGDRKNKQPWEW